MRPGQLAPGISGLTLTLQRIGGSRCANPPRAALWLPAVRRAIYRWVDMPLPIMMTFVTVLLLVPALAGEAQETARIAKIGVLSPAVGRNPIDDAFEQSLQAHGWVRDQNVRIELRYSAGRPDVFPSLAAELVGLGVDVLVAWSTAGALAAKRATSHIPVIFLAVGDPVRFGLVASLARPGGNATSVSFDAALETYPKGLELLKEAVPSLARVALLVLNLKTANALGLTIPASLLLRADQIIR